MSDQEQNYNNVRRSMQQVEQVQPDRNNSRYKYKK